MASVKKMMPLEVLERYIDREFADYLTMKKAITTYLTEKISLQQRMGSKDNKELNNAEHKKLAKEVKELREELGLIGPKGKGKTKYGPQWPTGSLGTGKGLAKGGPWQAAAPGKGGVQAQGPSPSKGKGKGKGKNSTPHGGMQGSCWTCGKKGPSVVDVPSEHRVSPQHDRKRTRGRE